MLRCLNNIFGYCHDFPKEATKQCQQLKAGPRSVVSLQTEVPGTCPLDYKTCAHFYSAAQECKDVAARLDLILHPDNGKGKRKRARAVA